MCNQSPQNTLFSTFKLNDICYSTNRFFRNLQRLYLGPNPVTNFDSLFLQGLDLLTLSLRNMSLTKVPSLISNLVRQCFKAVILQRGPGGPPVMHLEFLLVHREFHD